MSVEANSYYKVKLISAVFFARKTQLIPSIFLANAKALEFGLTKYPSKRVVCKIYTIATGNLDGNHEKLFTGQLRSSLVIGCGEKNDAFNGNYVKNQFNYKHYSLSEISLHLDGHTQPVKPLKPNLTNTSTFRYTLASFPEPPKKTETKATISRDDYPNGYALYAFYLTPDVAEDGHFNLAKQENVRAELKFGTALANTVTVVAYAEFENVIEIARNRDIVFDFGS